MTLSRRHVLAGGLAAGTIATTSAVATAAPSPPLVATGPVRVSPFELGIASGDPTPTGVVLWTRLAIEPLAADLRPGQDGKRAALLREHGEGAVALMRRIKAAVDPAGLMNPGKVFMPEAGA